MSSATSPAPKSLPASLRAREALFLYQPEAVQRIVDARQIAVFLKPGLGKTVITLTALADLGVQRTLVIAPAAVVERDVWGREARAWEHTRHLTVQALEGTAAQRRKALEQASSVETISYENAIWLSDQVELSSRYGAIVFDELSKLKHPGTARYRRLRARSMAIPIRIGLTGSPVGNHLLDIWAELFMVAGEKPLGPTYTGFRKSFFCPTGYDPRFSSWELKHPSCADLIHQYIKPFAFSLDAALAADKLPQVRASSVWIPLPASARKAEEELAGKCETILASGATLEALSASTLAGKVRQLASGAVYHEPVDARDPPGTKTWSHVHDAKLEVAREIVDEAQGEPILLFYWYQHELERLREWFPDAKSAKDPGVLDAWDRGEVELLLAHPGSVGHGLNLQSVSSTVLWFALPYSHELYEQGVGRLARPGQRAPWVTSIALLCGQADRAIYDRLEAKRRVQSGLMNAVRMSRIEDDPMFS